MLKGFGVEPMSLPGLGEFYSQGFITTDGDTWYNSQKLLKPSFDLSNIEDFRFFQKEADKLLETLPDDNSTVNLQPHLYVMVGHLDIVVMLEVEKGIPVFDLRSAFRIWSRPRDRGPKKRRSSRMERGNEAHLQERRRM